nr:resolvase [Paenibacillus arenosi]
MLDFLPSAEDEYRESIEYYGEVLETIIIERVFMPKIIKLLSEERNINLLESIFKYFEEVSADKDVHLKSIFATTVLEVLGNDRMILKTAQKYMGSKTIELQIEADRALGRI